VAGLGVSAPLVTVGGIPRLQGPGASALVLFP